jgi:hypothetical protein
LASRTTDAITLLGINNKFREVLNARARGMVESC